MSVEPARRHEHVRAGLWALRLIDIVLSGADQTDIRREAEPDLDIYLDAAASVAGFLIEEYFDRVRAATGRSSGFDRHLKRLVRWRIQPRMKPAARASTEQIAEVMLVLAEGWPSFEFRIPSRQIGLARSINLASIMVQDATRKGIWDLDAACDRWVSGLEAVL